MYNIVCNQLNVFEKEANNFFGRHKNSALNKCSYIYMMCSPATNCLAIRAGITIFFNWRIQQILFTTQLLLCICTIFKYSFPFVLVFLTLSRCARLNCICATSKRTRFPRAVKMAPTPLICFILARMKYNTKKHANCMYILYKTHNFTNFSCLSAVCNLEAQPPARQIATHTQYPSESQHKAA